MLPAQAPDQQQGRQCHVLTWWLLCGGSCPEVADPTREHWHRHWLNEVDLKAVETTVSFDQAALMFLFDRACCLHNRHQVERLMRWRNVLQPELSHLQ